MSNASGRVELAPRVRNRFWKGFMFGSWLASLKQLGINVLYNSPPTEVLPLSRRLISRPIPGELHHAYKWAA
jgi:hypothetical protein